MRLHLVNILFKEASLHFTGHNNNNNSNNNNNNNNNNINNNNNNIEQGTQGFPMGPSKNK